MERFKELGKNLFKPIPSDIKDVIAYRNKIIKDWHNSVSAIKGANPEIVWAKVAKRNGVESVNVNEFNQWIMDHLRYIVKVG